MKNGRSHAGVVGAIAAASVVAAVVTIGASAHTAAAPNLLKNGGADLGPAVNDSSGIVETIPSWTRLGSFTVVTVRSARRVPGARDLTEDRREGELLRRRACESEVDRDPDGRRLPVQGRG